MNQTIWDNFLVLDFEPYFITLKTKKKRRFKEIFVKNLWNNIESADAFDFNFHKLIIIILGVINLNEAVDHFFSFFLNVWTN